MFKNKWWIVVASTLALIVGSGPINLFAAGVFIKPIAKEFGFGRGQISTAIGLANLVMAICMPFLGRLYDRRGIRAVLLPTIVLYSLATAAFATLQPSYAMLLTLYAVQGFFGTVQGPTAYSKIISAHFDTQRGLALGIALAGTGLGTVLIPQFATFLLRNFGWRAGYLGLAVAIMVLAFLPVLVILRDTGSADAAKLASAAAALLPGDTFSEAVRTWRYWALLITFFFATIAVNGSIVHIIPLLTDRGMSLTAAVAALSASGMALIGGRLLAGYLMDKLYAPYIGMFFLLMPMAGLAILISGAGGAAPVLGTICLGLGVGAEIDLMSYIITVYFGVKSFGSLHGLMFAFALLANAIGASILGWTFQLKHTYTPAFLGYEVLLLIGIILFSRLGAYRYPPRKRDATTTAGEPAVAR
jgi:MFS family permease